MLGANIKMGEKLHIVRKAKSGEEEYLVSQFLEHAEDRLISIAMPIKEGRLVPIHTGSDIKVLFYRENGQYYFSAKVIDMVKGKIPVLRIERTSSIYKLQRREFFRLNILLPLRISIIDEASGDAVKVIETYTLDISGGGLRFAINKGEIEQGQHLLCEFILKDEPYSLRAKAVRIDRVYREKYSYEVGAEYVDIDERVRQDILYFIFEQQRKIRQKGMI